MFQKILEDGVSAKGGNASAAPTEAWNLRSELAGKEPNAKSWRTLSLRTQTDKRGKGVGRAQCISIYVI